MIPNHHRGHLAGAEPVQRPDLQRRNETFFIDELDALSKAPGFGTVGGHDEREQTLNQLLVELKALSDAVARHGGAQPDFQDSDNDRSLAA